MPIRKVISRSVLDGTLTNSDVATTVNQGAGFFKGENGDQGDTTNGKGDIFRVNEDTLNTSVTIATGENAQCAGPLTISTTGTVELTVNGTLTIV